MLNSLGPVLLHSNPVAPCCVECSSCRQRPGAIFRDLDLCELAELDRLRQTSTYPCGVTVYSEAEQPRAVYCVCSGRVKLWRSSPGGRAVVFHIAEPGDCLGAGPLLAGQPHDHTAETLEETKLCFVSRDSFLAFLKRNGDVSLRLAQKLSAELGEAHNQVSGLALKPAAERLMELLLALCRTHGVPSPEGIRLKTNMCQDELAELMGVSRRSLNRALGALRGQGLIECRRRFIVVRDRVALRNCLVAQG